MPDAQVARYTAYRVSSAPSIDGKLAEDAWHHVPRSPRFRDLVTGGRAIHNTQAAVLWDDSHLYVGYWIEEPFVRAGFTERDKPIYLDNDVELFIAAEHAYYEFEINAFGTIYEGLFVWQSDYERAGFSRVAELDRSNPAVRSQPFDGVGFQRHPRGPRWAFLAWDFPDLKSAVAIDGTINQDADRDRGWTVELAIPWQGMKTLLLGDDRALPPRSGDEWRIDFSRFNQYKEAAPANDSGGWAWSPHGVWDSHVPEVFPKIVFSKMDVADAGAHHAAP